MKEKIFLLIAVIIMAEFLAIVFLTTDIYKKHTLPTASVILAPKESFLFPNNGTLRHFREPAPREYEDLYVPPWLPYEPEFTINSDTLNERFEYSTQNPPTTFRIITLGDSWTFGQFVNTKDNYSERLEDMLNTRLACTSLEKFEVINLGVPSYDIQYSVERFKRRGQKYNPDLVLWLLISNDLDEIQEFVSEKMREYLTQMEERGELDIDLQEVPHALTQFEKPLEAYLKAKEDLINEFGKENLLRFQEAALNKIDDYYKKQLVIFSLPSASNIGDEYKAIIKDFVRARNDTYFYESAINLKENGRLLPDWHPSITGHALIAEDLFEYLTKNQLIPCD